MVTRQAKDGKQAICRLAGQPKRAKRAKCKFVSGHPAMALGDWLIVADLHLGITRELYEAGVSLPSQISAFVKRLHDLKQLTCTSKLILLGDVKHKVPGISWQEEHELPDFLAALEFDEIMIIKGNHDGGIEQIIPSELKGKVKVKKWFAAGGHYFTHGHCKMTGTALRSPTISTIVIGHNQPAVLFQDSIGARYIEPVWVRGPLNGVYKGHELIIMPAFNNLRGHALVNRGKFIGPIAKHISPRTARAFLLDGTDLGTLSNLKFKED
ncbi:MAG: metallophosphoesterase [Candidatus Aenigmatarchaeota archaeon]